MNFSAKILKAINEGVYNALSFDDDLPDTGEVTMHRVSNTDNNRVLLAALAAKALTEEFHNLILLVRLGSRERLSVEDNIIYYCDWAVNSNKKTALVISSEGSNIVLNVYRKGKLFGYDYDDLVKVIYLYSLTTAGKNHEPYIIKYHNDGAYIEQFIIFNQYADLGNFEKAFGSLHITEDMLPNDIIIYDVDDLVITDRNKLNFSLKFDSFRAEECNMVQLKIKSFGYSNVISTFDNELNIPLITQFDFPDLEEYIQDNLILITDKDVDRIETVINSKHITTYEKTVIEKMINSITISYDNIKSAIVSRNKLLARFAILAVNTNMPFLYFKSNDITDDTSFNMAFSAWTGTYRSIDYMDVDLKINIAGQFISRMHFLMKENNVFGDLSMDEIIKMFQYTYAFYAKYGKQAIELTKKKRGRHVKE